MTARDKTTVTAPQAWNTLAVKSQKTVDAYMHQIEEIMKTASETRMTGLRPYKSEIGPTNIPITALAAR